MQALKKFNNLKIITESPREKKDIFERLYATRLEQLVKKNLEILQDRDHQNLLNESNLYINESDNVIDDDELLGELGLTAGDQKSDITQLKHVKPRAEVKRPDEIAHRTRKDFDIFKPLFASVQEDLKSGVRKINCSARILALRKEIFFRLGKLFMAELVNHSQALMGKSNIDFESFSTMK